MILFTDLGNPCFPASVSGEASLRILLRKSGPAWRGFSFARFSLAASGSPFYKRDASCAEIRLRCPLPTSVQGTFGAITLKWPARTGKSGRAALIGAGDRGDVSADQGAVIQGFSPIGLRKASKGSGRTPSRTRNSSPHSVGGQIQTAQLRRDYEDFIGAKKHLVIGVSPDTGPAQESNAFAQWWKRSSGDGVAMSAGIISLLAGR
jgi:hypothetical protein